MYNSALAGQEFNEPTIEDSPEDQFRWKPDDPASIANDLEFAAEGLEWAMLSAGGEDFQRLYRAAKRIGEIADRSNILAELD